MSDDNQKGVTRWTSVQVYVLSAVCLLIGIAVGYLFRGSVTAGAPAASASVAANPSITQAQTTSGNPMGGTQAGSLPPVPAEPGPEQMKQMADRQVAPLLEELAKRPKDTSTLIKVGTYYFAARQFSDAAKYYEKAAAVRPTPDVLTKLSNAEYYGGSGDKAIATLNRNPGFPPASP